MTISFVLGNGTSRTNVNLDELHQYGKIYGCNALYRDFTPDYLIAVDQKMILKIQESNYQLSHPVWTNNPQHIFYNNGFNYFNPRLKWSSGPCALHLASLHKPTTIFILGFDFTGIDDRFNNIYSNSINYKSSNDIPTYWGNWEKQTKHVIQHNPTIQFIRIINDDNYILNCEYSNFKQINYQEFYLFLEKTK